MKWTPIIFNTEDVCAILDGRMTQTRRRVKQNIVDNKVSWGCVAGKGFGFISGGEVFNCPYGTVGDKLWVRETFWAQNETCDHEYCGGCDLGSMLNLGEGWCPIDYVATPTCKNIPKLSNNQNIHSFDDKDQPGDWWLSPVSGDDDYKEIEEKGIWEFLPWRYYTKHASIHMPRWASRIGLEIVKIRLERVMDITDDDAIAEGCPGYEWYRKKGGARKWFYQKWDKMYGALDGWVWVIEFKRIDDGEKIKD